MDTSFGFKLGVNGTANFAEADFVKCGREGLLICCCT
jgi:hypothetical protein